MPCQHFSSPPDGDGFRLGVDGVHRLVDQHRVPVEWVGLSGDEHSVEEGQGNVGQFAGDGGASSSPLARISTRAECCRRARPGPGCRLIVRRARRAARGTPRSGLQAVEPPERVLDV